MVLLLTHLHLPLLLVLLLNLYGLDVGKILFLDAFPALLAGHQCLESPVSGHVQLFLVDLFLF